MGLLISFQLHFVALYSICLFYNVVCRKFETLHECIDRNVHNVNEYLTCLAMEDAILSSHQELTGTQETCGIDLDPTSGPDDDELSTTDDSEVVSPTPTAAIDYSSTLSDGGATDSSLASFPDMVVTPLPPVTLEWGIEV